MTKTSRTLSPRPQFAKTRTPQGRTLTVGIFHQEQMLDFVNTIKTLPRHRYLWERSYPESERFDRAAAYNALKYDLRFGYLPTYGPSMTGANGITESFLTPPFIRVFIGSDTAANENTLASTRIHENVHYKQGFTAIGEASAGHDFFFDWADTDSFEEITPLLLSDLAFDELTQQEKLRVLDWVNAEVEAYSAQLQADLNDVTCLPISSLNQTRDSFNTYLEIQSIFLSGL